MKGRPTLPRTHCKANLHAFTPDNTGIEVRKVKALWYLVRFCKSCKAAKGKQYHRNRKAKTQ